jgi:hypothetical protein
MLPIFEIHFRCILTCQTKFNTIFAHTSSHAACVQSRSIKKIDLSCGLGKKTKFGPRISLFTRHYLSFCTNPKKRTFLRETLHTQRDCGDVNATIFSEFFENFIYFCKGAYADGSRIEFLNTFIHL